MIRISCLILISLLVSGCVPTPLYKWGGYESNLYAGYKDQTKMEELKVALENHVSEMNATGQKVAPGLYAELGTLYLQSGDSSKARGMYFREREAWPESKGFMDAMISNLDRQESARKEVAK